MNNEKRNNRLFAFLGFAAGAAAGWWLNTDQGRAWRKDTSDKINEWGQEVSEKATLGADIVQETVKHTIDQGQSYVTQAGNVIKEKFDTFSHSAAETAADVEESFKKGMKKAKNHIS
jgi:hypothetical protein